MVYRLTLAYLGTRYAGWQRQTNAPSVQQTVEEALAELLGPQVCAPVRIHGAGRTDAGVHARGQVAHLLLERDFPLRGLVHGTNHSLPGDVRVLAAARMDSTFHARKSTLGKVYRYRLFRGRVVPPLEADRALALAAPLDLDAVRRALAHLRGRHDWSAFAAAGGSHGQPYRRMFAASLEELPRELALVFAGDGFLRGMVRALVGTLLEVGRGQRPADDLRRLLGGRPRAEAGATAPAHGLTLERVVYPPSCLPLESYDSRLDNRAGPSLW